MRKCIRSSHSQQQKNNPHTHIQHTVNQKENGTRLSQEFLSSRLICQKDKNGRDLFINKHHSCLDYFLFYICIPFIPYFFLFSLGLITFSLRFRYIHDTTPLYRVLRITAATTPPTRLGLFMYSTCLSA